MGTKKEKSTLHKIIFGETRTRQVSGSSKRIVSDKFLSKQVYTKVDKNGEFTIKSKDGKSSYSVRQLRPSR
ncbi:hypothetical protein SAMN04488096_1215 [Mesonia phycicola]|uniref:Uncharacterized protein n=1 Tax=Mesonia phycicola TaxID=579105 RepID=A0A1M6HT59_9FLAO|nr:hypothetical protein [Mesonia phycicola]SHJ25389.1 hypothetical protein SAMN04488096_1215 [Mesonia phycicola]